MLCKLTEGEKIEEKEELPLSLQLMKEYLPISQRWHVA